MSVTHMDTPVLVFRDRTITEGDLVHIRAVVTALWARGRSAISRQLCTDWAWVQPNGYLKAQVCRMLLVRLEQAGYFTLPPPLRPHNNHARRPPRIASRCPAPPLAGRLGQVGPVTLTLVRTSAERRQWWELIRTHHYLGGTRIVGAHLYYLAFVQGQLVAALGWGAPAWAVACRDRWIGWKAPTRQHGLCGIVNNVRFLILPHVHVKYLASHLLARCAKQLSTDWPQIHGYPIYLLETFVDRARFAGTCYKAANWVAVGDTASPVRAGSKAVTAGAPKAVFCYPLVPDFRERLRAPT